MPDALLDEWLSAAEAARYLEVSRPRIHQLARLGVLDATRIAGRLLVHRRSLDAWASSHSYRRGWRPRDLRELRFKKAEILALAGNHGVTNVRVFGSVARGTAGSLSDVDLAVDIDEGRTALDIAELAADLEDCLGCPVDIVVARSRQNGAEGVRGILSDAVLL